LSEHAHALTGALTIAAARAIEERLFREHFRGEWIIAVGLPEAATSAMLLAINEERCIVGLDRIGRQFLASHGHAAAIGAGLWDVFERNDALHRHKDRQDLWTELQLRSVGSLPAILTLPTHSAHWQHNDGDDFVLRPRLDALHGRQRMQPANKARGGLPPAMLRRVREYVDTHLDSRIDLDTLAGAAGLSLYHFARAFKQSEGATPHLFVLQRRLAKAQELLKDHRLSLSEVALSVGFADQSHFARRFRELVGISPGHFRRLRG
jgi:AraC-like DNA-binding protein